MTTMREYLTKYGTRTTSILLRRYADELSGGGEQLRQLADELEQAMEDYRSHMD